MLVIAVAYVVVAAPPLVLALRVRARGPLIEDIATASPPQWPRLSVIVPARDEARAIEGALQSELACGDPALEIAVVDDRSTDGTGAFARRLAIEDSLGAPIERNRR